MEEEEWEVLSKEGAADGWGPQVPRSHRSSPRLLPLPLPRSYSYQKTGSKYSLPSVEGTVRITEKFTCQPPTCPPRLSMQQLNDVRFIQYEQKRTQTPLQMEFGISSVQLGDKDLNSLASRAPPFSARVIAGCLTCSVPSAH